MTMTVEGRDAWPSRPLGAEPSAGAILADGPVTDGTGGAQIADRRSVLRRPWLALLAAAGGAAALAGCDVTSSPSTAAPTSCAGSPTAPTRPGAPTSGPWAKLRGWTISSTRPRLDTHALDAKLAGFPALAMTVPQLYGAYPDNAAAQEALGQLRVAALIRAVESPAQLLERMVEFWSDHFNVTAEGRAASLLKIVEDREVMRVHALGRFKDLLVADASSPAMLLYLDNYLSKVDAINENYGRELLELHTVGRDNGYIYDDIVSTARLFTGWTIDTSTGDFVFRPLHHDPGPITIMGWTRPSTGTGYDHGVDFLHWLAMQPRTATRVCHKLAVRFVGDDPEPGPRRRDGECVVEQRQPPRPGAARHGGAPRVQRGSGQEVLPPLGLPRLVAARRSTPVSPSRPTCATTPISRGCSPASGRSRSPGPRPTAIPTPKRRG